jgi:hypothetical protein
LWQTASKRTSVVNSRTSASVMMSPTSYRLVRNRSVSLSSRLEQHTVGRSYACWPLANPAR